MNLFCQILNFSLSFDDNQSHCFFFWLFLINFPHLTAITLLRFKYLYFMIRILDSLWKYIHNFYKYECTFRKSMNMYLWYFLCDSYLNTILFRFFRLMLFKCYVCMNVCVSVLYQPLKSTLKLNQVLFSIQFQFS